VNVDEHHRHLPETIDMRVALKAAIVLIVACSIFFCLIFTPFAESFSTTVYPLDYFGVPPEFTSYISFANITVLTFPVNRSSINGYGVFLFFDGYGFQLNNGNITITEFFVDNVLQYNLTAVGNSTVSIYTNGLGQPISVTGAINSNYNSSSEILQVTSNSGLTTTTFSPPTPTPTPTATPTPTPIPTPTPSPPSNVTGGGTKIELIVLSTVTSLPSPKVQVKLINTSSKKQTVPLNWTLSCNGTSVMSGSQTANIDASTNTTLTFPLSTSLVVGNYTFAIQAMPPFAAQASQIIAVHPAQLVITLVAVIFIVGILAICSIPIFVFTMIMTKRRQQNET
jgi:hypothetical protein